MTLLPRLDSRAPHFEARLTELVGVDLTADEGVARTVATIIEQVRRLGDEALLDFTRRFDHLDCETAQGLVLPADVCAAAHASLPELERAALEHAATRIREFHERQLEHSWEFRDADGNRLGQRVTPIRRVGLYVPGGQAAYPSTVLMTAIPARVAGVSELVMTHPTPYGRRNPLVLAAAHLAGITEAYTVGGAQAIAALAFGTTLIAKADKIVGPGGAYVAAAKRLVYGAAGIDLIAGPSEVLIVTDGSVDPEWLALDLFSQAEHDELAQSLLLCPDGAWLDAFELRLEPLLAERERADIIRASLGRRGALIQTASLEEAIAISNRIAPEHLELAVVDPDALLPLVENAGAIFLGAHSPEVLGDYAAGPSHVLPTYGTARFSSPLGVYDFQKRSSVIGLSPEGARKLARTAAVLARGEGLEAHARAAELRIGPLDHNRAR
jgi:histidinol dehydrogenase